MATRRQQRNTDRACFKFSGKPKAAYATKEDAERAIGDNRILIARACPKHGYHVGHREADDPFERFDD